MSFNPQNIAVLGASGAIGGAIADRLAEQYTNANLTRFSRSGAHAVDYLSEDSLAHAARLATQTGPLDLVVVCIGILSDEGIMPEKSLQDLSAQKMMKLFEVNTIAPALIAKHFIPALDRKGRSTFATLSARVGSISDNQLGGWYAYRGAKAALNMFIKNAAIETKRKNDKSIIIGLHPGTVDSELSKPFQANVPQGKLFTPQFSAQKLVEVIATRAPIHTGKCFAWDGQEILP